MATVSSRWLLVVLLCICIALGAMLFVSGHNKRQHDVRIRFARAGHLSAVQSALLLYHDKYGHFPPAFVGDKKGTPMHSWRVLLLEFLNGRLFHEYNFNEPWNSPANLELLPRIPSCYSFFDDEALRASFFTRWVVVEGIGFAFEDSKTRAFEHIKDRRADTILVIEDLTSQIKWTEPRDLTAADAFAMFLNGKDRYPLILFADTEIGSLNLPISDVQFRALLTIDGGEKVDLASLLKKWE